jgi:hypothetical protein
VRANFFGKYRGVVTNNTDPLTLGRIKAMVPAVLGDLETGWALPCSPYGGKGVGFFFIPPVGANVWIEFEGGNPRIPIWSGCFWGKGEAPSIAPEVKVIKTDFATISINDLLEAGEIIIESATGLMIVMDVNGLELSNGAAKVKLTPSAVSINDSALEVI